MSAGVSVSFSHDVLFYESEFVNDIYMTPNIATTAEALRGSFTWPIPNAWRVKNDVGTMHIFCNTDQRFELDADGTDRVMKFRRAGELSTNRVYRTWETN